MSSSPLSIIILAAGKGTRMRSALPKVLQPLAHQPLLQHVINSARALKPAQIVVVYGHGGEQVRECIQGDDLVWVEQSEQLGTGHAVQVAMPSIPDSHQALVLYGDVPLLNSETLANLLIAQPETGIGLLTVKLNDPTGYGRIIRDAAQRVIAIVEQKDATAEQLQVNESNTGILCAPAIQLKQWLAQLSNDNAQREYYLTDVIAMAANAGDGVAACHPASVIEVEGVNDKIQLARLERAYQLQQAEQLMRHGALLRDPSRLDIRGELSIGQDVEIDVNVVILGNVILGDRVRIGANCVLQDCTIAADSEIRAHSTLEQAKVGTGCSVGPYARLRPGAVLADDAHVGNFVEVKNAVLGSGSKANHLTYIGDAEVGSGVNIGAGTITCNYDGANKHKTVIGNNAFIGSDSQLVAPVSIGDNATIAAGSTITKSVGADELVLTRTRQRHIANWKRPVKKTS